jgi:hypothetical protein
MDPLDDEHGLIRWLLGGVGGLVVLVVGFALLSRVFHWNTAAWYQFFVRY